MKGAHVHINDPEVEGFNVCLGISIECSGKIVPCHRSSDANEQERERQAIKSGASVAKTVR